MSEPFIPYGRHVVDDADIAAVVAVLRGDWLSTGPLVGQFEEAFAHYVGAKHAIAVSSGTAALHLSMLAAGIGPGDEVVVPALTFAATANCVRYVGAAVVFADVREDTLTIDVEQVGTLITPRTRAIVAVDYGGLPCDLDGLRAIARRHSLVLVEDACHALGARYREKIVGGIADLSAFSLHPVKHMTTGEGGLITTDDGTLASRLRQLRNHGIESDHRQRELLGTWRYDMTRLGYNYRLTDIQCALGLSQLAKMPGWLARRREIANRYRVALGGVPDVVLPAEPADREHAWHLYAIRIRGSEAGQRRRALFEGMRAAKIGVNVHYLPVYLHSYYRELGYPSGLCPQAERAYQALLSLPMSHGLSEADQTRVIERLRTLVDEGG
jgi:perosamine synthetase